MNAIFRFVLYFMVPAFVPIIIFMMLDEPELIVYYSVGYCSALYIMDQIRRGNKR